MIATTSFAARVHLVLHARVLEPLRLRQVREVVLERVDEDGFIVPIFH